MHACSVRASTPIINRIGVHGGCVGRSLTSGLTFDYRPAWSLPFPANLRPVCMHA